MGLAEVQFALAPLRTLSELVFPDMAGKTEMPTEAGNGNSSEIHFLPTTSEFQFSSAATVSGAVRGGNKGLVATFIRWCDLVRERSPRTLGSFPLRRNRKLDYGATTTIIRS